MVMALISDWRRPVTTTSAMPSFAALSGGGTLVSA